LVPALTHRSTLASLPLPGKRTTEDVRVGVHVGVEGRERHEQDEDHATRKGKWQMVAKNAATHAAAGARLIRRSAG
jgi:hypothetical protein